MKRRTAFTPAESKRIASAYATSTLRALAEQHHADPDLIRDAITTNGGAIRSSSRNYAAQHAQERASGKWKYGALNNYLAGGMPLCTALKMAHLADVPHDLALERLAQFRLGAFSGSGQQSDRPAKNKTTTFIPKL